MENIKDSIIGNENVNHGVLDFLNFESEKRGTEYQTVQLEAKGWIVRYIPTLKGLFLEPLFQPTARIKLTTVMRFNQLYFEITGEYLKL